MWYRWFLEPQKKTADDVDKYNNTIYGIEKKPMPYLLCITNMLIHDVDEPKVYHMNSLEKNVRDYKESDKFDIILMNPPYGGSEKDAVKNNFPADLRSSETADLFMNVIMYRLKKNGRCAVIIPDGFFIVSTAIYPPHSTLFAFVHSRIGNLFLERAITDGVFI